MNAPENLAHLRFGAGHAVRRIEDPALVTGRGRFTDDVTLPQQAHLAFVRSPSAHGAIVSIDIDAARAMPGVLTVVTGAELAAAGVQGSGLAIPFKAPGGAAASAPMRLPLAHEVVRYVGEPVVAVIAESRDEARAACDAVLVSIEDRPSVTGTMQALAEGAPQLWPGAPGNVVAVATHGDAAACEAAFARAARVVKLRLDNQRLAPAPMEPRAVLAWVAEDGRLTLRASTQMPTALRGAVAAAIPGLTNEQVRVVVGDVGGGFGMKTGFYPEDIVVAWAAWHLKRPVKWQAQRLEDMLSAVHGRDLLSEAELALDAEGRALALRVASHANVGACPINAGVMIQLLIGPWVSTSVYAIPAIHFTLAAVLSNTAPTGPYRGAGRPEAIYLIERLMDAGAAALGLDPAEMRRRNFIPRSAMPYRNPMGQTYDDGAFEAVMDQALVLADWPGFEARAAASAARGRLRGRGLATFLEWTGGNALSESVQVRVSADGFVELTAATMPMGQGIATSYAQLAVDVLGVPIDRIRVRLGDTDLANGFGSAGSRSLFTAGAAVHVAVENTVAAARELAAEALEAPAADLEYRAGRFAVAGTDVGIGLFELAARQSLREIAAEGAATAQAESWPNGAHVCEVEIDEATGEVEVVAYASCNDIGRIVSPVIVKGQIEGGAVQGIGQALMERVAYDEGSGQLLSASFMDYAMPRADGFRGFRTMFDQSVPCRTNLLGAKGVGELGTIGATPAVINAIVDALRRAGVKDAEHRVGMPCTSEVVWRALAGRRTAGLDEVLA
jgi:carbon-monoxide dehydrogenase large subunit